jgi:RNA polymerase sigma-70 factor (ECF subfamily)
MAEKRREDQELLHRALAGNAGAMNGLVRRLTPVIQARVARGLVRSGRPNIRRNLQEEIADLTQDIYVHLFSNNGQILRSWRPDAGLSLENFVGMVAQRRAISLLRSSRKNPWTEEPVEDLEDMLPLRDGPEALVASRQILGRIVEELERELSPLGWRLFQSLIVDEEDIADIARETGMKPGALYMWRSRLVKLVRKKAAVLMSESPVSKRNSSVEQP